MDHRSGTTLSSWPSDDWDDERPDGWPRPGPDEPLADGATHLLDLIAAVDHLGRGLRHRFTVWDALEEAIRWFVDERRRALNGAQGESDEPLWYEDDPLRVAIENLLQLVYDDPSLTLPTALQQATRRWATTMADRYNAGHHWPHPAARRAFPPPLINPA